MIDHIHFMKDCFAFFFYILSIFYTANLNKYYSIVSEQFSTFLNCIKLIIIFESCTCFFRPHIRIYFFVESLSKLSHFQILNSRYGYSAQNIEYIKNYLFERGKKTNECTYSIK